MKRTMVRYRVKPERVEENEALVRAVYAELAKLKLEGVQYMAVTATGAMNVGSHRGDALVVYALPKSAAR